MLKKLDEKRKKLLKQQKISQQKLEKLVKANYGLLVSQALSFNPRNQDELDDYIQTGCTGLVRAIKTHDSSLGALSTHICHCVRNSIINQIKYNKKHSIASLHHPIVQHQSESLMEYLPDNLTDVDRTIINMKLQGYTRKEIAKVLGCKENNVKYKIKRTFDKIRKANED